MRGEIRRATNHAAWAIGTPSGVGFHVRRVVWGQLMAVAEKREGEEIRLDGAVFASAPAEIDKVLILLIVSAQGI